MNDQWNALDKEFDWWANTFREAVNEIGYTLCFFSPWNDPAYLLRVWTLFELAYSKNIRIMLSRDQVESFYRTLRDKGTGSIIAAMCTINVENATSFLLEDKEKIFEVIRQEGGFHHFNVKVTGLLRDWIADVSRSLVVAYPSDGTLLLDEISNIVDVGSVHLLEGNLEDAKAMYERALEGQDTTLGRNHTSTLATVMNLGTVYYRQGNLEDAKAMYKRALEGQEKTLGRNHTSTLRTVMNLGNVHRRQGILEEARAMYKRALEGQETALGSDHPDTLRTVVNLGNNLSDQGNPEEAKAMYERALTGQEKTLGPNHTETLITVMNLGIVLANQGNPEEAKAMYDRALVGREKTLGPNHTSTLRTVMNLGNVHLRQGNLEEAKAMYERALAGQEMALGPKHTSTLDTVTKLREIDEACRLAAAAQAMNDSVQDSRHEHPLFKLPSVNYNGSYGCDVCGKSGIQWVFHCEQCGYDVHPCCVSESIK